jgi:hypothetical protein
MGTALNGQFLSVKKWRAERRNRKGSKARAADVPVFRLSGAKPEVSWGLFFHPAFRRHNPCALPQGH